MKVPVVLFAFVLLLCGCTSIHTQRNPRADLARYHRYYVEHRLTDDHHIDDAIVTELRSRGLQASAGPLTMMPDDAEVVVGYADTWAWDFKSYLYQLDINLRTARLDQPLAAGTYRQPTIVTKPPEAVIHTLFDRLLKHR